MSAKAKRISAYGRVAIAIVVIAVLLLFASPIRYYANVSPASMRRVISENLRRGTEQAKVLEFLNARQIEHSAYKPEGGKVHAIVRGACVSFAVECAITMEFSFDKNGLLAKAEVAETLTSL